MRCDVHADLGRQEIAGMKDIDPVSLLESGRRGKLSVFAEMFAGERKPGHGRDDLRFDFTGFQQFAQPRLNENAVHRAAPSWEKASRRAGFLSGEAWLRCGRELAKGSGFFEVGERGVGRT